MLPSKDRVTLILVLRLSIWRGSAVPLLHLLTAFWWSTAASYKVFILLQSSLTFSDNRTAICIDYLMLTNSDSFPRLKIVQLNIFFFSLDKFLYSLSAVCHPLHIIFLQDGSVCSLQLRHIHYLGTLQCHLHSGYKFCLVCYFTCLCNVWYGRTFMEHICDMFSPTVFMIFMLIAWASVPSPAVESLACSFSSPSFLTLVFRELLADNVLTVCSGCTYPPSQSQKKQTS